MNDKRTLATVCIACAIVVICHAPTLCCAQSVSGGTNNAKTEGMVRAFEAQIESLSQIAAEYQLRLSKLSEERLETSQRLFELNITDASYNDVMRLLQTQRVQLMIDLAGLDARQEKLAEMQTAAQQPEPNEVTNLLAQIVDSLSAKQERLKTMYEQGSLPADVVQAGEVMLLQAKLKLAEARANTPQPQPNDLLADVSIERVEKQAKLATVESLLKKYYGARTSIDSLQELDATYQTELQRKLDAEKTLQQVKMEFQKWMNDNN